MLPPEGLPEGPTAAADVAGVTETTGEDSMGVTLGVTEAEVAACVGAGAEEVSGAGAGDDATGATAPASGDADTTGATVEDTTGADDSTGATVEGAIGAEDSTPDSAGALLPVTVTVVVGLTVTVLVDPQVPAPEAPTAVADSLGASLFEA